MPQGNTIIIIEYVGYIINYRVIFLIINHYHFVDTHIIIIHISLFVFLVFS